MADVFCGPLPTNILHESLQDERQHTHKNEQSEEVYRSHDSIEKLVFLKRKNLGGKKTKWIWHARKKETKGELVSWQLEGTQLPILSEFTCI